jgi:spore coat protein U-like protein
MDKKKLLILMVLLLSPYTGALAQMLAFNIEAPPELNVTVISDGTLDYGNLFQNQGLVQILLNDPGTEVISIEGEFNKDVTVTITPPAALQLDPSNTLPYTLGAAYANDGEDNKGQATEFTGNTATFRIKEGGPPPGGRRGGGPPSATAYLYVYGDINVGNVNAGTYSGIINIFVEYD